ncbi:hypothetical protein AMECASPLE_035324, partial [Ameca splendens]
MHHSAHHRAQGKDTSLTSRRAVKKDHSTHSKEAALPPEMQNHQHPCQPSRNDRGKPSCGSPRANATATPHNLPYIGRGTVETTNPKHTPPTRNHPADNFANEKPYWWVSDGLADCMDPDCCLQPSCQNQLYCKGSPDPAEVLSQSPSSLAPQQAARSFYQRIHFLVGSESTHVTTGESPFNK